MEVGIYWFIVALCQEFGKRDLVRQQYCSGDAVKCNGIVLLIPLSMHLFNHSMRNTGLYYLVICISMLRLSSII